MTEVRTDSVRWARDRIKAMLAAQWTPRWISIQIGCPEEVVKKEIERIETDKRKGKRKY